MLGPYYLLIELFTIIDFATANKTDYKSLYNFPPSLNSGTPL